MPPRIAPTKLSNWPWVVVRVDCVLCSRRGCYRLARLAARYGPEQDIHDLLRDLAQDCPWYNERARKYEPRCGARFTDLDHLPPSNHPDEPIYRQCGPGREDVPKSRVDRFPAAAPGAGPMLSGWGSTEVGYRCGRCQRREIFTKDGLLRRYGDQRLTDLLALITAGCPRHGNTQVYELCGAMYLGLEG